ncbi:hypothetical protein JAAARDRAFT_175369 [Jaapia argillacea MUCL 33604]|uniref:Uncharacterized protein n=1 Tax=Jaapia argillacea MUCL 33604 TaxID=933084 RepID=A0A067Q8H4_9AGAM|nr:hypothetical protein JAAARDRAFT_175369 [Jaapia argillacea MUCL 33604]
MASPLHPNYSQSHYPQSPLFKNPSDSVPPTEELEVLHSQLTVLKQKALEKAKKAGNDLRYIEESMKRMKEKEKGKAKAIEKVKKEHDFTPIPEPQRPRVSTPVQISPPKPRFPSVASIPSTSSKPSVEPRKSMDDVKKKKKKRKREQGESDEEPGTLVAPSYMPTVLTGNQESQRPRKTSPSPALHSHPHKASKAPPVAPHPKPSALGPDFSVPPSVSIPKRPPLTAPPIPGPSKPTDVTEDFSKIKPPAQTQVTSFYTLIDPWLRPVKEEDVGFLEYTADEVEPYVMPKLGRHYSEVWEEEDIAYYGAPLTDIRAHHAATSSSNATIATTKWDPSTLNESDLIVEEKGHGPLTERLVSALLPMPDSTVWKGVKAAEDAMEGRPGITGAAFAAAKERVSVAALEDRIKDTMRFHGLLDGKTDYSEAVDDPISAALRQAQRQLRNVVAINKARKSRLAAIARDRLGYQEYLDLRDNLDRNLWSSYSKAQKKESPKLGRKKKKIVGTPASGGVGGVASLPPCPAALGMVTDEEYQLVVPENVQPLVKTRRQWVDVVGSVFDEKERESPGRIYGLPKTSVFEGLEREVREELERTKISWGQSSSGVPAASGSSGAGAVNVGTGISAAIGMDSRTNGKGKGKARVDEPMILG